MGLRKYAKHNFRLIEARTILCKDCKTHYGPQTTTENLQRDHLSHLFTKHGSTSHKPLLQVWLKLNLHWGLIYQTGNFYPLMQHHRVEKNVLRAIHYKCLMQFAF